MTGAAWSALAIAGAAFLTSLAGYLKARTAAKAAATMAARLPDVPGLKPPPPPPRRF